MDQKPTILFIHGAWHTNEAFGQVQNYLAEAGYGIKNVQLPSSSVEGPYVLGIDDDVEVIRNALEEIVHAKGDVVIVMHSYGGIPGSSAVRGFSKTDRQKQGKDGGVTQMIYMTALALDEGVSLKSGIGGSLAPWVTVHGEDTYMTSHAEAREIFYNDLPEDEAIKWIAKLQKQATKSFDAPSTSAAWKYIPSTYVLCGKDNAIPIEGQEYFINQDGANFKIERLDEASHSPFLSMPKETADAIRRAAGEKL